MKKVVGVFLASIVSLSILTGCGLLNDLTGKANAVVLYGTEDQVTAIIDNEKKDSKDHGQYNMKVLEQNEKKIMIMDQKTAKSLIDDGLWAEVDDKNRTDKLTVLPDMKKDQAILFAKEEDQGMIIDGQELEMTYSGNIIIGEGRAYVDMFLIVPDKVYSTMSETEQSIGFIRYSTDPSNKIENMDVEYVQLLKINK